MDATAAVGAWKKTAWQALALAALFALCYFWPLLAFGLMFLLPLAVCPAFSRGEFWFALGLPIVPLAACALAGFPLADALLTLLPSAMALAALQTARLSRADFTRITLLCIAAYLLAALAVLMRLRLQLGGELFSGMAAYAVSRVEGSVWSGNILYRLAAMGYLSIPESFRSVAGLPVGDYILLNPLLQRELVNMLRLRLHEDLALLVPQLLMQGALVLGLFTALRTARELARKDGKAAAVPLFRTLHLPRREQRYMLLLCVGIVLTSFSDSAFLSLLCTLMYAAFSGVYQLLGAAAMLYLLSRNHPQRAPVYGVLAAALYALFPLALFILGMADQFLHLRASGTHPQEHQEEE